MCEHFWHLHLFSRLCGCVCCVLCVTCVFVTCVCVTCVFVTCVCVTCVFVTCVCITCVFVTCVCVTCVCVACVCVTCVCVTCACVTSLSPSVVHSLKRQPTTCLMLLSMGERTPFQVCMHMCKHVTQSDTFFPQGRFCNCQSYKTSTIGCA